MNFIKKSISIFLLFVFLSQSLSVTITLPETNKFPCHNEIRPLEDDPFTLAGK